MLKDRKEPSFTGGGNVKDVFTMENSMEVLKRLKIELSCDLAI